MKTQRESTFFHFTPWWMWLTLPTCHVYCPPEWNSDSLFFYLSVILLYYRNILQLLWRSVSPGKHWQSVPLAYVTFSFLAQFHQGPQKACDALYLWPTSECWCVTWDSLCSRLPQCIENVFLQNISHRQINIRFCLCGGTMNNSHKMFWIV